MMPGKSAEQRDKYKIGVVALLLVIVCSLVYYFHVVLKTGVVVSHFFYVPIILACIWWKRKGLTVAVFSSAFLIFSHIFIRPDVITYNDYARAITFIVFALVVTVLSEYSAKVKERLLKSEEKWRSLVENAPDIIMNVGRDGTILFINRTIPGFTPEQAIGTSIYDYVPPEHHETMRKSIERVFQTGEADSYQIAGAGPHGTTVWYETRVGPIKQDGQVVNVTFISTDITERKQAESALKKAEQDWRNSFNSLEDIMLIIDKDFNIENINENGLWLLDKNKNEVIGKKCYQLIHNDEKPCDFCPLKKSLETKAVESIDRYEESFDKHFSIKSSPIFDENGEIVKYVDLLTDITERKQAEEALKKSESRYQELFNTVIEGISLVDENEVIQYCNPAFAKIFEEDSPDDMVGKNLLDYVSDDQKKLILSHTAKRKRNKISQYEVEIITAKGNKKFIYASISPRFDGKDNYIGAFGAAIDITETKRLQEFALRAQRLETAGRIAGQVAHDFNNLLAPLTAYPELIKEELPKDHPVLQYIEDIEKSAEQMAEINQQLLTLGRRAHHNLEPLNINEIVLQVVNQIHPKPETLVIETDLSDNLMNIKGAASQIFRVVLNLVTNARDAMLDAGHLTIKTENYYVDKISGIFGRIPRGEYVRLTVSDTGSGISSDIMSKILDPFFTTKTTTRKRGSGLGLSIVHAVVEDHNGYIDVESVVGKGTRFYLYFPITRESLEETKPDQIAGGIESILIVDDDPVQRDVVLRLSEKLGYNASTVESGEKAIDFIKENPQDLLVLDMIMPEGIDGTETYKNMLKINPSQKAIIVSGFKETKRVEEALKLGAGAFIRKPLTLKTIGQTMRKELDR